MIKNFIDKNKENLKINFTLEKEQHIEDTNKAEENRVTQEIVMGDNAIDFENLVSYKSPYLKQKKKHKIDVDTLLQTYSDTLEDTSDKQEKIDKYKKRIEFFNDTIMEPFINEQYANELKEKKREKVKAHTTIQEQVKTFNSADKTTVPELITIVKDNYLREEGSVDDATLDIEADQVLAISKECNEANMNGLLTFSLVIQYLSKEKTLEQIKDIISNYKTAKSTTSKKNHHHRNHQI